MTISKDHSRTEAARRALDTLFDELEADAPTDAMRWAVYGYIYGLDHAGVITDDEFDAYLARLGISGDEADIAEVAL